VSSEYDALDREADKIEASAKPQLSFIFAFVIGLITTYLTKKYTRRSRAIGLIAALATYQLNKLTLPS